MEKGSELDQLHAQFAAQLQEDPRFKREPNRVSCAIGDTICLLSRAVNFFREHHSGMGRAEAYRELHIMLHKMESVEEQAELNRANQPVQERG